jgi:hypothetical protein
MATCYRCKRATTSYVKFVEIWKGNGKMVSTCYGCCDVIKYGPDYLKEARERCQRSWGAYYANHIGECSKCQTLQFDTFKESKVQ